jgi:hypothetical protein
MREGMKDGRMRRNENEKKKRNGKFSIYRFISLNFIG